MTSRRLLAAVALLIAVGTALPAQRRPGVGMGFYTTTGLLTGDIEGGSVTSSASVALAPTFALSGLVTASFRARRKHAWIGGLRVTALSLGNRRSCIVEGGPGCRSRRFEERGALLTGGAFDVRAAVLRAMVGPSLYDVAGQGARLGTAVRVDFSAPQLRGSSPTLFVTRTFLGSERGEPVGMTTLGAGFRWVRKR